MSNNTNLRVSLQLYYFFHDYRQKSRIFVNKDIKTILDLKNYIKETFEIENDIILLCDNNFLPDNQEINVLRYDDSICVIPKKLDENNSENIPKKKKLKIVTEKSDEPAETLDNSKFKDIDPSPDNSGNCVVKPKKNKRKRKRCISEDDNFIVNKSVEDSENSKVKTKKKLITVLNEEIVTGNIEIPKNSDKTYTKLTDKIDFEALRHKKSLGNSLIKNEGNESQKKSLEQNFGKGNQNFETTDLELKTHIENPRIGNWDSQNTYLTPRGIKENSLHNEKNTSTPNISTTKIGTWDEISSIQTPNDLKKCPKEVSQILFSEKKSDKTEIGSCDNTSMVVSKNLEQSSQNWSHDPNSTAICPNLAKNSPNLTKVLTTRNSSNENQSDPNFSHHFSNRARNGSNLTLITLDHNCPNWSPKGSKTSQNGSKLSQNGPKLSQNGPNTHNISNTHIGTKMSQNGPNLIKYDTDLTQNGSDLTYNAPNSSIDPNFSQTMSNLSQTNIGTWDNTSVLLQTTEDESTLKENLSITKMGSWDTTSQNLLPRNSSHVLNSVNESTLENCSTNTVVDNFENENPKFEKFVTKRNRNIKNVPKESKIVMNQSIPETPRISSFIQGDRVSQKRDDETHDDTFMNQNEPDTTLGRDEFKKVQNTKRSQRSKGYESDMSQVSESSKSRDSEGRNSQRSMILRKRGTTKGDDSYGGHEKGRESQNDYESPKILDTQKVVLKRGQKTKTKIDKDSFNDRESEGYVSQKGHESQNDLSTQKSITLTRGAKQKIESSDESSESDESPKVVIKRGSKTKIKNYESFNDCESQDHVSSKGHESQNDLDIQKSAKSKTTVSDESQINKSDESQKGHESRNLNESSKGHRSQSQKIPISQDETYIPPPTENDTLIDQNLSLNETSITTSYLDDSNIIPSSQRTTTFKLMKHMNSISSALKRLSNDSNESLTQSPHVNEDNVTKRRRVRTRKRTRKSKGELFTPEKDEMQKIIKNYEPPKSIAAPKIHKRFDSDCSEDDNDVSLDIDRVNDTVLSHSTPYTVNTKRVPDLSIIPEELSPRTIKSKYMEIGNVMEKEPQVGDKIIFKTLKLNEEYTPVESELIYATILTVGKENENSELLLELKIIAGHEEFKDPKGRFSMMDETELETEQESDADNSLAYLRWKDIIEPKLIDS